jgi:biopolymer transport protein ExbD
MSLQEFNAYRSLEKPDTQLDLSSVLCVLLFIFGLSLLGSRFVFSPGVEMELPRSKNIDLQLTSGVLSLNPNGLIMFDNQILRIDNLAEAIENFLQKKKDPTAITLLVSIDCWVSFGFVVEVMDVLKSAGCKKIHIACEPKK